MSRGTEHTCGWASRRLKEYQYAETGSTREILIRDTLCISREFQQANLSDTQFNIHAHKSNMSPLEHFLVALIPVAIYLLLRRRRLPSKSMLVVICFGSLFPDIVDKPIAYADLIPWGRVFMHSLPFAIPVVSLVLIYAVRTNRLHLGAGFSAGYLLHLPGDWHQRLLRGEIPPDLLWPIVSVPA
ncbi:MAG: putative membrane-bound metal-dependent hydrolase (DUF457), partial [Haloquadratum sp. J07HQX50]